MTLSTQDNVKLLEQLKSGFKRTINWNKYLAKESTERQHQYFDYLIDLSFQGVYRLLVLSIEDNTHQRRHTGYFLPEVEINNYNVMNNGQKFFDQPVKNGLRTYENFRKIATG